MWKTKSAAAVFFCLLCYAAPVFGQWKYSVAVPNGADYVLKNVAKADTLGKKQTALLMPEEPTSGKIPFVAAALSFILPGMGEVYAGRFSSGGQYFLGADIALVTSLLVTVISGNVQRAEYQTLARLNANIIGDKTDQFWIDIADYQSWQAFNEDRLRRRQYGRVYTEANAWQWNSEASRLQYRQTRISSETAFQAGYFVVAAMALNRLLSAINAVRLLNEQNDASQNQTSSSMLIRSATPASLDGLGVGVQVSF